MARRGKRAFCDEESISQAKRIIADLRHGDTTITAISVLLTGILNLTSEQIGQVLCVSSSTVIRMNRRFCREKKIVPQNWGGDRRSILTSDKTLEVLESLKAEALQGKIVVVKQVKSALEEKRGSRISLQTVYNILHRHGWRKISPDKVHPKSDPEKQDEFKKKLFPMRYTWQPFKLQ